jgi:hypothetical protein
MEDSEDMPLVVSHDRKTRDEGQFFTQHIDFTDDVHTVDAFLGRTKTRREGGGEMRGTSLS